MKAAPPPPPMSAIGAGLPPRPPATLDVYLDAAERCVSRYGWSRVSPKDIATEAGVERTTIYRNLGAKEQIWQLLIAREVYRLIDRAMAFDTGAQSGPELVVEAVCMAVEHVLANPVMAKVIADDPELVGGFLHRQFADVIDRFTTTFSPLVAAGMADGRLAKSDPVMLTQWVIRIAITLVLAPAKGPLRPFVSTILLPALTPPT
ncbi:MAG: TetR/AcrR family transcriptional regulator [Sandaracinaceae bacterium]|nr:TetR/AcrR family transcriptional regulator [Sandaracinaceae bacterium]MBK7155336.1 TetR/AcrR family transcriptional regulator [Sandaracinaceae bacterium]MBK8412327.1 TetR/AcrR family transcriptional regulator [Sandaracinaceae bacterium]MBK8593112.1 TetR/AcrR family transcriptional regulator [Sandaracinaceae bacterium]MBP7685575.1 TetR/AcrR family transcriptional regulator [Deltaproteobacteria bacterium]